MESGSYGSSVEARGGSDEPGVEWCFDDRRDAGQLLGAQLRFQLGGVEARAVVAIVGGGTVVAAEVARIFDVPLVVVTDGPEASDVERGTVIVVDEGLVTGASMLAAVRWARARGAGRVVVGVPIAASTGLARVSGEADEVVWGYIPERLDAVRDWYEEFAPVPVEEEIRLLEEARLRCNRRTKQARGRRWRRRFARAGSSRPSALSPARSYR